MLNKKSLLNPTLNYINGVEDNEHAMTDNNSALRNQIL